jgi:multiple sugar transport system ATP-binding protein
MVFQNYALYPHMTVAENMGFALKIAGLPKTEIRAKVADAAKILDLTDYLERKPKALSGGQRQRVAMGRAIVRQPQVFLMDEPLSNLDAKLRVSTRTQIAALQGRLGTTTVYVTHDHVEALTMGDRVAVLKDGLLQQVGTPKTPYERPGNAFVAGFIGSPAMNLLRVPLVGEGVRLGAGSLTLPRDTMAATGELGLEEVVLGVRPEHLRILADGGEDGTSTDITADPANPANPQGDSFEVTVEAVEELGSDAFVYAALQLGDRAEPVVIRTEGRTIPSVGDHLRVAPAEPDLHLFSPTTDDRLVV